MASNRGQKVFIWVIAVTMLVGSIGASFLVILANDNAAKEQAAQQKQLEEQQKRIAATPEALKGYKVEKFKASKVKKLETKDIKVGTGKVVTKESQLKVNYFGWLANGKVFDSTTRGGDNQPAEFGLSDTIEGWIEGLDGAKEGGVRQLTIPADKAYGDEASEVIPANSPLMFIVEILEVK